MQGIKHHYPNAISLNDLEQKISSDLNLNGFILSKTIWGTSICSDEVNNSFNLSSNMFAGPGPFRFGGISGIPFTGKTGVAAFVSHIPEKGSAFILYGPHIGISDDGTIGEIHRQSQPVNSTCCGSLIAGLDSISSSDSPVPDPEHDRQQYVVIKMLESKKEEILEASNQIKTTTDVAYTHISEEVKWLIKNATNVPEGTKIYLMGGILINTDWDKEDWLEVRDTELIEF